MSDPHADLEAGPFLAALGVEPASRVTRIAGGWDTAIWRVEAEGDSCALRVFRPDQTATWAREREAMATAGAAGLPVPAIRAAAVVAGRPALLLDWVPGETLLRAAEAHPWRVWRLGHAFGRAQARLHRVPAPAVWRDDPPLRQSASTPEPLRARLAALPAKLPVLLHLDYHPLNVMIERGRVSGVLDWANARGGDPRYDLAKTTAILRLAPIQPGTALPIVAGRRLLELAWRRGYARAAGRWPDDLAPYYAWVGAWMHHDLSPKLGRPGVWLRQTDLDRIRRWTEHWLDRTHNAAN